MSFTPQCALPHFTELFWSVLWGHLQADPERVNPLFLTPTCSSVRAGSSPCASPCWRKISQLCNVDFLIHRGHMLVAAGCFWHTCVVLVSLDTSLHCGKHLHTWFSCLSQLSLRVRVWLTWSILSSFCGTQIWQIQTLRSDGFIFEWGQRSCGSSYRSGCPRSALLSLKGKGVKMFTLCTLHVCLSIIFTSPQPPSNKTHGMSGTTEEL